MPEIIMIDDDHEQLSVSSPEPKSISPPDEPVSEDLSYEDVLRRQDDIDQLTAEYISNLMHPYEDVPLEFEPDILEAIENRFEEVLADEFGIYIYRPTILRNDDGTERVVASYYEEEGDLYGHHDEGFE